MGTIISGKGDDIIDLSDDLYQKATVIDGKKMAVSEILCKLTFTCLPARQASDLHKTILHHQLLNLNSIPQCRGDILDTL